MLRLFCLSSFRESMGENYCHALKYAGTGEVVHHHSLLHCAKGPVILLTGATGIEGNMAENEKSTTAGNLIWIDLEMTGLDTANDRIIEIATVVTDVRLTQIVEGPVLTIHQPEAVMQGMDDWNTRQHGESGLTERVLASKITVEEAEQRTLDCLEKYVQQGASPMCGNSICQDRRFLARQMPRLEAFFHYRNLDVTTLKILAEYWAPKVLKSFTKSSSHRALDDIRESIAELAHYRDHLLDQDAIRASE